MGASFVLEAVFLAPDAQFILREDGNRRLNASAVVLGDQVGVRDVVLDGFGHGFGAFPLSLMLDESQQTTCERVRRIAEHGNGEVLDAFRFKAAGLAPEGELDLRVGISAASALESSVFGCVDAGSWSTKPISDPIATRTRGNMDNLPNRRRADVGDWKSLRHNCSQGLVIMAAAKAGEASNGTSLRSGSVLSWTSAATSPAKKSALSATSRLNTG